MYIDGNKLFIEQSKMKKEFEIIANINIDDKDFIVYTDDKELADNKIDLFVNSLIIGDDSVIFGDVTNEELKLVIRKLQERVN